MTGTRLLTADDLLALGDACHAELVEGRLVPLYAKGEAMSPAAHEQGEVAMEIGFRVTQFVRAQRLGRTFAAETGFRLRRDPDTVRAPDFAFVASGHLTRELAASPYLDLAPDLVVEVVSPGDAATEIAAKVQEYRQAGARLIWVAYPPLRTIVVHHPDGASRALSDDDVLLGEDVLPGISCRVVDLFPEPFA